MSGMAMVEIQTQGGTWIRFCGGSSHPISPRHMISWLPHKSDEVGVATFDGARAGLEAAFIGTFAKLEAYTASLQA